jgi:hypothetical protein
MRAPTHRSSKKAKKNKNNDNKAPRCLLNAYNILFAIQRNEIIRKQQEAEEAGKVESHQAPKFHEHMLDLQILLKY